MADNAEKIERNKELRAAYAAMDGAHWPRCRLLADEYGVTPQRIHVLVTRPETPRRNVAARNIEIQGKFHGMAGRQARRCEAIAAEYGLSAIHVWHIVNRWQAAQ